MTAAPPPATPAATDPAPWGAYPPPPLAAWAIGVTRRAPDRGFARKVASVARDFALANSGAMVDAPVFGVKVRFHPKDNLSDRRALFFPQLWDAHERAALARVCRPGFVFIDVGANSGLYSLFCAVRSGPTARILAVEPQPGVVERLRFNIAANGFSQIEVIEAALAEGRGTAGFVSTLDQRGEAHFAEAGETPSVVVPTLSLLELMDDHAIERADAIKFDIEGAEDRVVPPFLRDCPPERLPKMVLIETISKTWSVDCAALLETHGYRRTTDTGRNAVFERA